MHSFFVLFLHVCVCVSVIGGMGGGVGCREVIVKKIELNL